METEVRELEVRLSETERSERARKATAVLAERDAIEARMKAEAAKAKARIKELEAELREVSRAAREGFEIHPIACVWVRDDEARVMRLVRPDTDATVDVRPMTGEELQLAMFPRGGASASVANDTNDTPGTGFGKPRVKNRKEKN